MAGVYSQKLPINLNGWGILLKIPYQIALLECTTDFFLLDNMAGVFSLKSPINYNGWSILRQFFHEKKVDRVDRSTEIVEKD